MSFFDFLTEKTMIVEIVLDNAKSHVDYRVAIDAFVKPKKLLTRRKCSNGSSNKYDEDEDVEIELDDLRDCKPTGSEYIHNSFPGREDALGAYKANLCRWACSSSDSDFAHVPSHFSFDRMLKEASSGTESARANVSRPVRRSSIKAFSVANEQEVLNSLSSNLLESMKLSKAGHICLT